MRKLPDLYFTTEEVVVKEDWEAVMINNLIFVKTKGWTMLINNAAPYIEADMRCPTCTFGRLNPYILVGSGLVKGLFNCIVCATNVIVGFTGDSLEFIIKAYNIDQKLIDENWKPEQQKLQ